LTTNNNAPAAQSRVLPAGYWQKRIAFAVFAVILVLLSSAAEQRLNDYEVNIIRLCGISVLMAVSLNIVNGLTGQFSIGHAGFMAVGAYVGASVTYLAEMRFTHQHTPGLAWMLGAMVVGGLSAALFGLLVGVPSLRLQGDYLAIVTLGFSEIIRVLLTNCSSISPQLAYLG
jgi:branched-chain amino acid transport system permease protein